VEESSCPLSTAAALGESSLYSSYFFLREAFGSRGWAGERRISATSMRKATIRMGGEQRIQFKIYPDGRVEETVLGVKGEECLKVTEEINEKLGKVISTENTTEMLEQPLNTENRVYESNKAQW
jgi:hypothetical protein